MENSIGGENIDLPIIVEELSAERGSGCFNENVENLSPQEQHEILLNQLRQTDNEIESYFLKRREIADSLCNLRSKHKFLSARNPLKEKEILYSKYCERGIKSGGVIDLAKNDFDNYDPDDFELKAFESFNAELIRTEIPRTVLSQGIENSQPKVFRIIVFKKKKPKYCETENSKKYYDINGKEFVPNYNSLGISYSRIKKIYEGGEIPPEHLKRIAYEFGLKISTKKLHEIVRDIIIYLVENKFPKQFLSTIKPEFRDLYHDNSLHELQKLMNGNSK